MPDAADSGVDMGNWGMMNTGDVSPDGVLYLATGGAGQNAWFAIDVNPTRDSFMDVVDGGTFGTGGAQRSLGPDWSYDPSSGTLLSIGTNGASTPADATLVFRFDPATGAVAPVHSPGFLRSPDGSAAQQGNGPGRYFSATWTDAEGYLYAKAALSGDIWRLEMDDPSTLAFFSYGASMGNDYGNDGASCATPVEVDFGDAPDEESGTGYGTLLANDGPRHGLGADYDPDGNTAEVMLGATVDPEEDGQPSDAADGDDLGAPVDDEDALSGPVAVIDGEPTVVPVTVTNDSDGPATLAGWIDIDGDGDFEPGERTTAAVPAGSGTTTVELTFAAVAAANAEYARLRIYPGQVGAPQPTGPVTGGEVEDWPVESTALDLGDAPDSYGTLLASDGARHAVVDHDPVEETAPLMLGGANTVDVEADAAPGASATGDDEAGVDDESAIAEPVVVVPGRDATFAVVATNETDQAATLAVWLDLDQSGTFGTSERRTLEVPAESGTDTYEISFAGAGAAGLTTDTSYLRARLFAGTVADPQPTGLWVGGEVEDYRVQVDEPAYAVTKSVDGEGPRAVGETVSYRIEIENTGDVDFTTEDPATVSDDLAEVLDDATWDGDVSVTSDAGGTPPGASYAEPTLSWQGPLAVGETVTITYTVTVQGPPGGDATLTNGVVGGDCPTPPVTDPDAADFDPTCATVTPVRALEVVKTGPDLAGARAGDEVTYSFQVTNIGAGDYTVADPAVVVDDLTDVVDDATYDGGAAITAGRADGTLDYTEPQLTWSGPLEAGQSVTVSYTVTITAQGDRVLTNVAFQPDGACDPGACEPPDNCTDGVDPATGLPCDTVTGSLPALEIEKSASGLDGARIGDTVTYRIEVTNTGDGDYTAAAPATFVDDLSQVLDDATYNGDAVVESGPGSLAYAEPTLVWTGPLAAGESAVITYTVTIDGAGDTELSNTAFAPAQPCEPGECSAPPETCVDGVDPETDRPCATVTGGVPRLAVEKSSADVADAQVGDTVRYEVVVSNTGAGDFTDVDPATVVDDLSGVLDDAVFNDDAEIAEGRDDGTLTYAAPRLVWSGAMDAGESLTLTYSVTVTAGGDLALANTAFQPPEPCSGPDCAPTPACPDGVDPATGLPCDTVTGGVPFLDVDKVSPDIAGAQIGDTVTYRFTVTNTGEGDYTADAPAVMVDDMSGVLDDATYAGDAVITAGRTDGTLEYVEPTLVWSGPLDAGSR
ncbi:DUF7927 domain-containing protein [Nocardioides sambongensis]|uniref:DUF7927 domain-containing protein n=1 Tax=Nocardioides sambongensis TaxID=2589074 RepID=UPI0011277427|nr:GEVED domain-containing protein [Nocardioides sambongensis]